MIYPLLLFLLFVAELKYQAINILELFWILVNKCSLIVSLSIYSQAVEIISGSKEGAFWGGEVTFSHLLRYSSNCVKYREFLERAQLLTQKLPTQGNVATRLKSSLQKFYGRHHNMVDRYKISISQMTMDLLLLCFLSFITAKTFTELDWIHE